MVFKTASTRVHPKSTRVVSRVSKPKNVSEGHTAKRHASAKGIIW